MKNWAKHKRKNNKIWNNPIIIRRFKIIGGSIVGGLFLCLVILYLLTPFIISRTFENKITHLQQEKNVTIRIEHLAVKHHGLFTFSLLLKNVSIQGNTVIEPLLNLNNMELRIVPKLGWKPKITFPYLKTNSLKINIIKDKQYSNYAFLSQNNPKGKNKNEEEDYSILIKNYLRAFSNHFPRQLDLKKTKIFTEIDSVETQYVINSLIINKKDLVGDLHVTQQDSCTDWKIWGDFDFTKHTYHGGLKLDNSQQSAGNIPIIDNFLNMQTGFRELSFGLTVLKQSKEFSILSFDGKVRNAQLYSAKIADETIRTDSANFALNVHFKPHTIEIDSSSTLSLKDLTIHPYFLYEKKQDKHIKLFIHEKKVPVQSFLNAFPHNVFPAFANLNLTGNLNLDLNFDCYYSKIEDLVFNFAISGNDIHFSPSTYNYFNQYNGSFQYTYTDHNIPLRTITMDTTNTSFCTYTQIPVFLKNAILVSEDPSFFNHNGFLKSAIRDAMVTNIQRGKFVRGGSTITMQLVKNLFLNKKKIFARKFEELVLVWLIEDYNMISKSRMFEIYTNIIEWGPCIIGINEAAEFYFDKTPKELTLSECIYLATLIRAPKSYSHTLNSDGSITESRQSEIQMIADRMFERKLISQQAYSSLNLAVKVNITPEKLSAIQQYYTAASITPIDSTLQSPLLVPIQ